MKKMIETIMNYFEYLKNRAKHYSKYYDEIDWIVMAAVVVLILVFIYGVYFYETNK